MDLVINDNIFRVKCMVTPRDIQNGMMGKTFDESFDGMLFLMEDGNHSFWMRGCIISLDILFIKNNQISKIYHNSKPCDTDICEDYLGSGEMVLELPGNTCKKLNINEGDQILI